MNTIKSLIMLGLVCQTDEFKLKFLKEIIAFCSKKHDIIVIKNQDAFVEVIDETNDDVQV